MSSIHVLTPVSLPALLLIAVTILAPSRDPASRGETSAQGSADHSAGRRGPLFGRVLDLQGRPIAGAEVHLISNLVIGSPELGGNDVLRVLSDHRGKFRARLLKGRGYSVWAWADTPDGSRWASRIHERARPGPALDLTLLRAAPSHRLQQSAGPDGERFGKISYRLGGKHFVRRTIQDLTGDNPQMPRLAGDQTTLTLHDEKGQPLRERWLSMGTFGLAAPVLLKPKPRERVSVRIREGNEAIVGVRILLKMSRSAQEIATTDEDGKASFVLERRQFRNRERRDVFGEILLLKAGYPVMLYRPMAQQGSSDKTPVFQIEMKSSKRLEGRLLDADGKARAGLALAMYCFGIRSNKGSQSVMVLNAPLVSRTDSEGKFRIAGLNGMTAHRLLALPADGGLPMLLSSSGAPPRSDLLLGDLYPKNFVRTDLTVKNAEGKPLPAARVVLGEAESPRGDSTALYRPFWLYPDWRARVGFLCRVGLKPAIAAAWEGGFTELDPQLSQALEGILSLELRLPNLLTLSGQLESANVNTWHEANLRVQIRHPKTHALRVTRSLMTRALLVPRVRADGSFQFHVRPGANVKFEIIYNDPLVNRIQQYHGRLDYKVYSQETQGLKLRLQDI